MNIEFISDLNKFLRVVEGLVKHREDLQKLATIEQAIQESETRLKTLREEESLVKNNTADLKKHEEDVKARVRELDRTIAAKAREKSEIEGWINSKLKKLGE